MILPAVVLAALACSEKKGPVKPPVCDCRHLGDVNGDSTIDIFDVTRTIDVAFNHAPDTVDVSCPQVGRADVNCDCIVDSVDANYMIDWVLEGGPRPCNPCEAGNECPRLRVGKLLARR